MPVGRRLPEDATAKVEAFDDPATVHLIAGGYDKKVDLGAVAQLAPRLAGLYAIGATGRRIADAAAAPHAAFCGTLDEAVRRATPRMRAGDVLLLSPGCASWDQFENYEQRGAAFAQAVRAALGTPNSELPYSYPSASRSSSSSPK